MSDKTPKPSYKLYYFQGRGRAEASRLILAYAGIKYEDVRLSGKEQWPEFKPKTPFGTMPVLEEDGKMVGGSLVIARYLGEKHGIAGGDAWENAKIANIVDFVSDFMQEMTKVYMEKDEAKKAEIEKKFKEEAVPKYLGKLNGLAGDSGYLWNSKLSWADLVLYTVLEFMKDQLPWDTFTGLKKLKENVEGNENIAKWLKERPETEF